MRVLALVFAARLADQSTTGQEHHRGVSNPEEEHAVELMRYVTPYSTDLDVMKDVSHLAPKLMAKELRGYSFIDTWATQPSKVLWENEAQTKCQAVQPTEAQGSSNGFEIHAELLYWPRKEEPKSLLQNREKSGRGRVTQVVMVPNVRPMPFGSPLLMGNPQISLLQQEGEQPSSLVELQGGMGHRLVELQQSGTKFSLQEGEVAKVFACDDTADIARSLRKDPQSGSSLLGLGSSFLEVVEQRVEKSGQHAWDLGPDSHVEYISERKVSARLDPQRMEGWYEGAQVYKKTRGPADPEARLGAKINKTYTSSKWGLNGPAHTPIGFVESMDLSKPHEPRALVQITRGCPCEDGIDGNAMAWRVMTAKKSNVPRPLSDMLLGTASQVKGGAIVMKPKDQGSPLPYDLPDPTAAFLEVGHAAELKEARPAQATDVTRLEAPVGKSVTPTAVVVPAKASLIEAQSDHTPQLGKPVCVMRTPNNQLAQAEVDFGAPLAPHEKWYAHVVQSGHGWEHTAKKCAEFCEAEFRVRVNNADASSLIKPWRTDCEQNPNNAQQGTWMYSRNGWCPGAVANGQFVDVTELAKGGGKLPIEFELAGVKGADGTYSNMDGYVFDDKAMAQTQLTFHRYTELASEQQSLVEADTVVRDHDEEKESTAPPFFHNDGRTGRGDNGPWHEYDKSLMEYDPPLYRVPIFSGSIHEMRTRLLTTAPIEGPAGIDPEASWQIAARLWVGGPSGRGLRGDEWDRMASFGLLGQDGTIG